MLDAEFLDWLSVTVGDAIHFVPGTRDDMRALWEAGEEPPHHGPFGGAIQLIFVGDFLQLPPVGPGADDQGLRDAPSTTQLDDVPYRLRECAGKPAFMSVCWREAKLQVHSSLAPHFTAFHHLNPHQPSSDLISLTRPHRRVRWWSSAPSTDSATLPSCGPSTRYESAPARRQTSNGCARTRGGRCPRETASSPPAYSRRTPSATGSTPRASRRCPHR